MPCLSDFASKIIPPPALSNHPPPKIAARSGNLFALLLTTVAFQYELSDCVPKTSYSTALGTYTNACFVTTLVVGAVAAGFSMVATQDIVNNVYMSGDPSAAYSREWESGLSSALFGAWLAGNGVYWQGVRQRVLKATEAIAHHEQLGWQRFRKKQREVWDRDIRD